MDEKIDISPSDTSTKTLSVKSQHNIEVILARNFAHNEINPLSKCKKKRSKKRVLLFECYFISAYP